MWTVAYGPDPHIGRSEVKEGLIVGHLSRVRVSFTWSFARPLVIVLCYSSVPAVHVLAADKLRLCAYASGLVLVLRPDGKCILQFFLALAYRCLHALPSPTALDYCSTCAESRVSAY